MHDIKSIYNNYYRAVDEKDWATATDQLSNLDRKLKRMEKKDYWQDDNTKKAFLDDMDQRLEQERAVTPGEPQALGQQTPDVLLAQRKVVELAMGQAVVADVRTLIFFSQNFLSCSPVAMYNSVTHRGGLYHFPARGLEATDKTKRILTQMYNDIKPTDIWLNDRSQKKDAQGLKLYPNDAKPISEFLQDEMGYQEHIHDVEDVAGFYKFYYDDAKETAILEEGNRHLELLETLSVLQDKDQEARRRLAEAWRNEPAAMKYGMNDW